MAPGSEPPTAKSRRNLVAALFYATAGALAVAAAIYGPTVSSLWGSDGTGATPRPGEIAAVCRALLAGALVLALAGFALGRIPFLDRATRRPSVATAVLVVLFLAVPLGVLEIALAPFSHYRPTTGLFLRDAELGWRLRPSADEIWGDQRIRTNAQGLRGPELSPTKPRGVKRVLFLGDSVTFGYRVAAASAFPAIGEELLGEAGFEVEGINAGVGGYSPWQYDRYLRRSGIHLDPDVVVLGFVLNDVTEKFQLVQFGGSRLGVQVSQSLGSFQDRLARHSNLFHQLRRLLREWRFGGKAGALQELDVRALVERPEDPDIETAWRITLENLDRIFAFTDEAGIPALLVAFPYAFQLEVAGSERVPQRVLREYAGRRGLPFLDAAEALEAEMSRRGLPPSAFFIDPDHLSGAGHRIVAGAVVGEIVGRGWLLDAGAAADGCGRGRQLGSRSPDCRFSGGKIE